MAKQSGLGDRLFVDGINLSGDIGSLSRIGGGLVGTQDTTGIDKSAFERLGLVRDGSIEFTAFFNPATDQAHEELSPLPTDNRILNYYRGFTQGDPSAGLVGKQINYDPTRNQDGSMTIESAVPSTNFGLEWGVLLSEGLETETVAGDGTSIDLGAAASFGLQAYLHVTAGTVGATQDATINVQDSADNVAFATIASFTAFDDTTVFPLAERIQTSRSATVRQFLRWNISSTGGFGSLSFAITVVKNVVATNF